MKRNLKYLICILLITFIISFKCGFDQKKKPKPKIHPIEQTHPNTKYRNLESRQITIKVDYEVIQNKVSSANFEKIKTAFEKAIGAFQAYLKISTSDTYSFTKAQIDEYKADFTGDDVPELIANSISWGDVILVPVIDTSLGEGVDAAAYPLALDTKNKRPILGCVCLGTHYDYSKTNAERYLGMLLLHEISHVLAFNEQLFQYFINITNPTIEETVNGATRKLLATPKVLYYARGHFGCPSLTGVELENQGGDGSAGSHWEARIMLGDYMLSTDYPELVVSDITLAVFEDSGWYTVNYYTGGLFKTGKGEGCNFLQRRCIINEKSYFPLDFCDNTDDEVCSPGLLDRGTCYLAKYSNIPSIYQYFDDPQIGGYSPADYCPASMSYASSSGNYYLYSRCDSDGLQTLHDGLGEVFGQNSFCFQSSLFNSSASDNVKSKYGNKLTARCYKVENCDNATLSYDILIEGKDFGCEDATEEKTYDQITGSEGITGEIVCPPYWRVCGGTQLCNDPFECASASSETTRLFTTQYVKNKTEYNPSLYSEIPKKPVKANSGYVKICISFILFLYILII